MTQRIRPNAIPVVAAVLLLIVYILLAMTGELSFLLRKLADVVPRWLPLVCLILTPMLFAAVGVRTLPISLWQRDMLLLLALVSFSMASLTYHIHPLAFLTMLGLTFAATYWVVPRVNRSTDRDARDDTPA